MTPNEATDYLQLPGRLQALENHTIALIEQEPDRIQTIRAELARHARDVLQLAHELSPDSRKSRLNWNDLDPQIQYMIYRYLFVHHEPISLETGISRTRVSLSAQFLACNSDIRDEGRSILYGCNTIRVSHRPHEALYRHLPALQLREIRKISIKASHLSKTRLDELRRLPHLQEILLYKPLTRATVTRLGAFNDDLQRRKRLADGVLDEALNKHAALRGHFKAYLDSIEVRCVFGMEITPRFLGGNSQDNMFFAVLVDTDNNGITTSVIDLMDRKKFFRGAR